MLASKPCRVGGWVWLALALPLLGGCKEKDPRGVLFEGVVETESGTEILLSEAFDVPVEGRLVVTVTVQRGASVNVGLLEKAPYRSEAVSPRIAEGEGTQVVLEVLATPRRYELLVTPNDRPIAHRMRYEVELK